MVTPSSALDTVSSANLELAAGAWAALGFEIQVSERARRGETSARARAADLQEAFEDPGVDGVFTAIGGSGSHELLPHLDWQAIASNPKFFCGFSDATILLNEIAFRCGFRTHLGPHFSSLAMQQGVDLTVESMISAWRGHARTLRSRTSWSDDPWYEDQVSRTFHPDSGMRVVSVGRTSGPCFGGNISVIPRCDPGLWPETGVLLLEAAWGASETDRQWIEALEALPEACVRAASGLVVGRFRSGATPSTLEASILERFGGSIPVVVDAPFGHTTPMHTLDLGGRLTVVASAEAPELRID